MTPQTLQTQSSAGGPFSFREFVALSAALMALGAMGVDTMLPALPAIGASLGVATDNERQFVIAIYLGGLGIGQLLHGPLSDRWGRRPVMIVGLIGYVLANLVAAASSSFVLLLAARLLGGFLAAATRVVTVAIVRDCYSGRAMARAMSLVSLVFMIAPVLAPALGQFILTFGTWRLTFEIIAALSVVVLIWFWLRMPETLAGVAENMSLGNLVERYRKTITNRWSLGYTLAATMLQGALFGYITSIQQIVTAVFRAPQLLTLVFAGTAGMLAVANLFNAQVVMRLGSRFLSHTALVCMIAVSAINVVISMLGLETVIVFVALQGMTMCCFSLSVTNFNAMAMQDMGEIAGTASSLQGFSVVTFGALIGATIGQAFAGTTLPLHLGFLVCGLIALMIVAVAERGRLFRPH